MQVFRYALLYILFLGTSLSLKAQSTNSIVQGVLLDKSSAPIPSAQVSVRGANLRTETDSEGKYHFSLPAGQYTLQISRVGFSATSFQITVKQNESLTVPTILLSGKQKAGIK